MWIVRLALKRPYTFIVAALLLLLITPVVLLRTPTDVFPDINIPVVSCIWSYSGLSAQEMERRIVFIHERSVTTLVNDIEHVESQCLNGVGVIKMYFQPGTSVDAAVAQVTAISQTVMRSMPPGIQPPLIVRYSASTVPILQFGVSSPTLSEQELFDLSVNYMRVGLSTIRGASIPYPYGGKIRQVMVDMDNRALQAKGLSPSDVVDAINAGNVIAPSGTAKIGETEYDVAMNTSPPRIADLNNLPVKTLPGGIVYVRDVANVHDGFPPQVNIVRQNGHRGLLISILKSGSASTLEIVANIRKAMPRILSTLPPEMHIETVSDQSLFVRAAVNGVITEGVIAAALTALMILLFLGNWRSTLIVAISIPLSVLASVATLSALGETINLMTLGGLALAVGILVDDATVTIENITERRLENHGRFRRRHSRGRGRNCHAGLCFHAVHLHCVCADVFFDRRGALPLRAAGRGGGLRHDRLLRSFPHADPNPCHVSAAQAPRLARGRRKEAGLFRPVAAGRFETWFKRLRSGYAMLLAVFLSRRGSVAVAFLLFCAGSWLLIPQLGQDFFPSVDAGEVRLHLRARTGTRVEETARLTDQVEKVIRQEIPAGEMEAYWTTSAFPTAAST